jgi:hypothetical protein
MTRDQAILIVKHFDIVSHFSRGGQIDFNVHSHDGKDLGWSRVTKDLVIDCLPRYRKRKIEDFSMCACGHGLIHHQWKKRCEHSFCTCKKFKGIE